MRRIKVNCLEISGTHNTLTHTQAQTLTQIQTAAERIDTDTNRQTETETERQTVGAQTMSGFLWLIVHVSIVVVVAMVAYRQRTVIMAFKCVH